MMDQAIRHYTEKLHLVAAEITREATMLSQCSTTLASVVADQKSSMKIAVACADVVAARSRHLVEMCYEAAAYEDTLGTLKEVAERCSK